MTKNFDSENRAIAICLHEGCVTTPLLNRVRCSKHHPQFEKYGFSWDEYPREAIADWKSRGLEPCEIPSCESRRSSAKSPLCRLHQSDRSRKRMDMGHYLRLMTQDCCEICGTTDRLVIDHLHGHHENKEIMCEGCVRGRICQVCNSILGFVKDDPNRLIALAGYLLKNRGA